MKLLRELKRLRGVAIYRDKNGWPHCPTCHEIVYVGQYCRFCGQKILGMEGGMKKHG